MSRHRWTGALALAALLSAASLPSPLASAPAPAPGAKRMLIVSIDGLRPDVLLRAGSPAIRGLMARGSFSMWATTTAVAVTLPSHVSMLTGVTPARHGVTWNSDQPTARRVYPARPTLFELAKAAGLTSAMAAGKSKFSTLAKPGTLDWSMVPEDDELPDSVVTDVAVGWIRAHAPQVMLVHLPDVDLAGHDAGWGSSLQLEAIERADRCVARLLGELGRRGLLDSTVVLITSDHGGARKGHGANDPRSRHIPWIIAGPGIRKGFDLTRVRDLDVRTEDTFATACELLGLRVQGSIDGRPVRAALAAGEAPEALTPATPHPR
jgi:predicted AlkP superfamily pyrophosphatase or phosphodiesterase